MKLITNLAGDKKNLGHQRLRVAFWPLLLRTVIWYSLASRYHLHIDNKFEARFIILHLSLFQAIHVHIHYFFLFGLGPRGTLDDLISFCLSFSAESFCYALDAEGSFVIYWTPPVLAFNAAKKKKKKKRVVGRSLFWRHKLDTICSDVQRNKKKREKKKLLDAILASVLC